jgi:hypothetical protein
MHLSRSNLVNRRETMIVGDRRGDDIARHRSGIHVTYNGWPLYFFSRHCVPLDTKGQGRGHVLFVLDPAGNAIGSD